MAFRELSRVYHPDKRVGAEGGEGRNRVKNRIGCSSRRRVSLKDMGRYLKQTTLFIYMIEYLFHFLPSESVVWVQNITLQMQCSSLCPKS